MTNAFSRQGRLDLVSSMLTLLLLATVASHGAEQITSDAIEQQWGIKNSTTSQGRIIWTDGSDVFAYQSGTITTLQTRNDNPGFESLGGGVDTGTVFALGSGSSAGEVIAAWRRGANGDYAWIWTNTGSTVEVIDPVNPFSAGVRHNPEGVAIADGHVFMVLQAFSGGNAVKHLFEVNPGTGATTNLTGTAAVPGVSRVSSSGNQAAWVFDPNDYNDPNDSPPLELQFFDGSSVTTVDTGELFFKASLSHGRLVYAKTVAGVRQVFLYDSTVPSPAPVQITTDITGDNVFPLTDGRHITWLHGNLDGTNRDIMLYGAVPITRAESKPVDDVDLGAFRDQPYQLQRGQLLWNDKFGVLRYEDGRSSTHDGLFSSASVDIAPAAAFSGSNCCIPSLADGIIAWIALSTDAGLDAEVFRELGTTPSDSEQPAPPLLLLATPGDGSVTLSWDKVIGATSYNVYRAKEPGVTKDNYASLVGGTKTTVTNNSVSVSGLANNVPFYFVVTSVAGTVEGGNSREAQATPFGTIWNAGAGAPLDAFFAVAADPTDSTRAYAGHSDGVYVSVDGGGTWTSPTGNIVGKNVHAVAARGSTVYAATTADELFQSTDHGATWGLVASSPIAVGELNKSLAIDPSNTNVVYAGDFHLASMGSSDSLLIKSANGGSVWGHLAQAPGFGDDLRAYGLVVTSSGVVYAGGTGTPNLAKSIDGGASWTAVALPNPNLVYSVAVDPVTETILYAGTLTNGAYKSTDSGATWVQKTTGFESPTIGVHSLAIDPTRSVVLYAGTDTGAYYSPDGGEHWAARNGGIPSKTLPLVYALAFTSGRHLIAATSTGLYALDLSVQNHAPQLTNPGAQTNAEGDTVSLQLIASDQDGDTITYGASGLPPGLGIDTVTGVIGGTVAVGSAGEFHVTATASDGLLTGEASFTWTVSGTPGDTTGDGTVNAVDIQVVINEALGIPTGFNADLNCDAVVNAVDVQLVINAALGLPISPCP